MCFVMIVGKFSAIQFIPAQKFDFHVWWFSFFLLAKFYLPSCNLQSVAILLHFVVILKCFGFVVGVLSQLLFSSPQSITYNYYSYRYSLKNCMRFISMDGGMLRRIYNIHNQRRLKGLHKKKMNKCNLIGIYFKNFDLHCFANLNKTLK